MLRGMMHRLPQLVRGSLVFLLAWLIGQAFAAPDALSLKQLLAPQGTVAAALSPDGRHVALVQHHGTRMLVQLVRTEDEKTRVLRQGSWVAEGHYLMRREPRGVLWITADRLAIDYGFAAEAVDLDGGKIVDLGSGLIGKAVPADPESTKVLVFDDDKHESVAVVDVQTRRKQRLRYPMRGRALEWAFDETGAMRVVVLAETRPGQADSPVSQWFLPAGAKDWVEVGRGNLVDERWRAVAAAAGKDELIVSTRVGRERSAIQRIWPLQPERSPEILYEHPDQDVLPANDLRGAAPQSFISLGLKPERHWLDPDWAQVQQAVDEVLPGRVNLLSGSPRGQVLIFSYADVEPGRWYLLNVPEASLRWLAAARQQLEAERMRPMQAFHYMAADGLQIPAYLTLPAGQRPAAGWPSVVLVHGGPAVRDHWVWEEEVQLLASRGYAVLQPQFRGSTGFGRSFETAGHGQWGLAMQDDVRDGVRHLVEQGIADPQRVCIVGASYGGYAAVWGLMRDAELYRCGVTLNGVADIGYMLGDSSDSNADKLVRELQRRTVGSRQRDREAFDAVSPLRYAARLRAPLLIAHAEEDLRVPISHARKLMSALQAAGKRPGEHFEWLPLRGDGHGLMLLASRHAYYSKLLAFLGKHLGSVATIEADRAVPAKQQD